MRRSSQSAFTLLELIIVILILGIMAAMVAPAFVNSLNHARIDSAAHALASAFRFARVAAASTGRNHRVTVDPVQNSFWVESEVLNAMASLRNTGTASVAATAVESGRSYIAVPHPIETGRNYLVNFSTHPNHGGVEIVSAAFGSGTTVVFDPHGAVSAPGTVAIRYGSLQQQVNVTRASVEIP